MSWYDGVPAAALNIGPLSNLTAAAAAATTAQGLLVGATGNYYVPVIPAGFFQLGKPGQAVIGVASGTISLSTTATTATFGLSLCTSAANATGATVTGTAIGSWAQSTAWAAATTTYGWTLNFWINSRAVGYGTTSVSTSVETSGTLAASTFSQATNATTQPVSTFDATVAQYIAATVTFSTSSTSNTCTLTQLIAYGMS